MNGQFIRVSGKWFRVSLPPMEKAYIGIGGNLGRRERFIEAAIRGLSSGGKVTRTSRWYETAPWKMEDAPDFINLAVEFETWLSPEQVLALCLSVERQLGRRRDQRLGYASRTIDLDVLLYGAAVVALPELDIPHPGIADRRFVLEPLCDLIPMFVHPTRGKTLADLRAQSLDKSEVRIWESPTDTSA
jgi:2-amino-4-hydroxy-6-hydroxymethyldihydropteridine diphosphokinase